jgi:phosphoribosylamine---glycine ligase
LKVLIVGGGGREHAIAWKLFQSPKVTQIYCIPGNAGTASLPNCTNLSMSSDDLEGILRFAEVQAIGLTVVGPEIPLALGIVDNFQAAGMPIFGPTQAGAKIESSKSWAKDLMKAAGIPTSIGKVFSDAQAAIAYVRQQGAPIVVKADGLASGKGVTVAETVEQAVDAIQKIFDGLFGAAGETVVIEECLQGEEASVLAITDGITIRALLPAQDHKRLGEGDTGPNTGGMGAYAPAPLVTPEIMAKIQSQVLEPAIAALRDRGIDYRGCLYAGLMITPDGEPKVIEFNCRFGDPETQAVLPLLDSPLDELLLACVEQRLAQMPPIAWKPEASVCVVIAAGGYPEKSETGKFITGIGKAEESGAVVFQAGTKLKNKSLVTAGGRVLGVAATAETIKGAITKAYGAIKHIEFDGLVYRSDIGWRAVDQDPQ